MKTGDRVTYIPKHTIKDENHKDRELGIVKRSMNKYIFVDYNGNIRATKKEDLEIGDQTFYCPDEHDRIMDSAFGRCESQCDNCRALKNFMARL